jgi:hypothetical protein
MPVDISILQAILAVPVLTEGARTIETGPFSDCTAETKYP